MRLVTAAGRRATAIAARVVPDPFVIALLLLGLAFGLGLLSGKLGPLALATAAGKGMMHGPLLAFALQMALILATGHALAAAPPVQRGLSRLAALPKSPASAVMSVAGLSMALALFNWGLGLVAGAFFARAVSDQFRARGAPLNHALVAAAGYAGLMVWHGGLSGSAPLKVVHDDVLGRALPLGDTVLSTLNLVATGGAALAVLGLLGLLARGEAPADPVASTVAAPAAPDAGPGTQGRGFVARVETSVLTTLLFVVPAVLYLGAAAWEKGTGALGLGTMIVAFFAAGLLAHRTPRLYAAAFQGGAVASAGILLQFPIYFAILAVTRDSGLLGHIVGAFVHLTDALGGLLPAPVVAALSTFVSAGALNVLVPSGGGQWVLQAPILAELTRSTGASPATMLLAFCYGDQLTNMLQPFWALPLLAITGVKAKDLLGYTALMMFAGGLIFAMALAVLG